LTYVVNESCIRCKTMDCVGGLYVVILSAENDLSDHKFKIGESVLYTSRIYGRGAASGVYKITQLLPSESDDCQYRIKSSDELHERVVKESELKRDL
jgi:hypothetical protein